MQNLFYMKLKGSWMQIRSRMRSRLRKCSLIVEDKKKKKTVVIMWAPWLSSPEKEFGTWPTTDRSMCLVLETRWLSIRFSLLHFFLTSWLSKCQNHYSVPILWLTLFNKASSFWLTLSNKASIFWLTLSNKAPIFWLTLSNKASIFWLTLSNKAPIFWIALSKKAFVFWLAFFFF